VPETNFYGSVMKLVMPRFDQARVLIAGDVMLDRYWHGPTSRISPEAPVPIVKVEHEENRPGGAGNVALNIAALGANAVLAGVTGDDEAAHILQQSLVAAGVECNFQTVSDSPTITKLRILSRHQQLIRMDFESGFDKINEKEFQSELESLLNQASVLVLSDYGKGALRNHQELIQAAKKKNIPVLVDPKGSDFSIYRGASLITPNLSEFEAVVGVCADENELVTKGLDLISELDIGALLVTRGEQGMTLLRSGEHALHLPARAREVFDVTGAGDTVISVLAASLAAGEELPQATALANLAASIVVGKLGTAAISAPELRRVVQKELGTERGVISEDQLKIMIADAREHGESIVMTNGCFDILHAGHVAYLEQAKALGDRLIVAVNNDESIKRIKGEGRPINPVERRMAVLSGLGSVDWVLPFDEDTPERLLKLLQPDVLTKGGDYRINEVVGADIVKNYGGKVEVLNFVDDCSTTAIVNKIKKNEE